MGQIEVYQWMQAEAILGNWRFFTTREVEKGLKEAGFSNGVLAGVRGDLIRLTAGGYLDGGTAESLGEWPGRFRLKRKYLIVKPKA